MVPRIFPMNHQARALRLLAFLMLLSLALPPAPAMPAAAHDLIVDVHGAWGISELGTDGEGANCDRWAAGPGGGPSVISDTDPGIESPPLTSDEN
jgi:hypothetical protein